MPGEGARERETEREREREPAREGGSQTERVSEPVTQKTNKLKLHTAHTCATGAARVYKSTDHHTG